MQYFNPKEYRANRSFLRTVKRINLFTFFVSKVSTLEPFNEKKRPWVETGEKVGDFDQYVTTAIIDFILPSGKVCRVPKGFLWDGASIPKFAQKIIGKPMGKYALAGLLHDWLYSSRILGNSERGRKEADKLFLLAMRCLKISWWRRKVMYRAVRIGGFSSYFDTDERNHCVSIFLSITKYNPFRDYKGYFHGQK